MNILIVGDSLSCTSPHSGLKNATSTIWHSKIPATSITNISMGGQSNLKIFNKTLIEIIKNSKKYDLVIVQWTSLLRLSLNMGKSIHDNQVNFVLGYPSSTNRLFKKFQTLWESAFCNPRVALLEWMSQVTALATFLTAYNQKFIFIKGFTNFIDNLVYEDWHDCDPKFLELVLHLSTLDDDHVTPYYNELRISFKNMVKASENNWVNLLEPGWIESAIDIGDDNVHPDVKSHILYAESVIKKLGL